MAYSIEIDDVHALVIVKFWDLFDSAGFLDYLAELEASGPFADHFNLFLIFHEHTRFSIESDDIRRQAQRKPTFSKDARRVVVAPSDMAFGLSRLYGLEAPTASDQYSTVKHISEALTLLNLNPAEWESLTNWDP